MSSTNYGEIAQGRQTSQRFVQNRLAAGFHHNVTKADLGMILPFAYSGLRLLFVLLSVFLVSA